jgi:hypothetical protein
VLWKKCENSKGRNRGGERKNLIPATHYQGCNWLGCLERDGWAKYATSDLFLELAMLLTK